MRAAISAAGLVAGFALGWAVRRLASRAETEAVLPGDELLPGDAVSPGAPVQVDRAVTIGAAPEAVWPWIAQLGQHRAGFYSLPVFERAIGCDPAAARCIHPEWQQLSVGDVFALGPLTSLRVMAVEPGHHLVLGSVAGSLPWQLRDRLDVELSWAFVCEPVRLPVGRKRAGRVPAVRSRSERQPAARVGTRLHVRERYLPRDPASARWLLVARAVTSVVFVPMLRRLSRLR